MEPNLIKAINKYGLAIVLSSLFIYNSMSNKQDMRQLQKDYLLSQKEDRDAYIKLNKEMLITLGSVTNSVSEISQEVRSMRKEIKDLELQVNRSQK